MPTKNMGAKSSTLMKSFKAGPKNEITASVTDRLQLILLGYGFRRVDHTRQEVWVNLIPRVTGAKIQPWALINEKEEKWVQYAWDNIEKFEPWVDRIPVDRDSKSRKAEVSTHWRNIFPHGLSDRKPATSASKRPRVTSPSIPSKRMKKNTTIHTLGDADAELIDPNNIPTPQRMNELSKFIFGKHFQMITIPDARLMLAVREHRILMPRENIFGLPKLFAFLVDTKQHPMFTHPGQGKKLVNLDPLLARLISYKEGYEDFFDEKDFGMFGGEVVNPDPYPSMDAEENEDYRRLEAATAKAMEWKWKRKSDEGWGLRG